MVTADVETSSRRSATRSATRSPERQGEEGALVNGRYMFLVVLSWYVHVHVHVASNQALSLIQTSNFLPDLRIYIYIPYSRRLLREKTFMDQ